jgi:tetratricopeptide (TPR) repeat protein
LLWLDSHRICVTIQALVCEYCEYNDVPGSSDVVKSTKFCATFLPVLFLFAVISLFAQNNDATIQLHRDAAAAALKSNDLSRAEQEYRAILAIDPKNVEASSALGVALYASGNFSEASSALQNALSLNPSQPRIQLFLALTQAELGQCTQALPVLKIQWKDQSDPRLRRLAGLSALDCESAAGHLSAALQLAEPLRAKYPDDPDVLYKLAGLYSRLWNEAAGELIQKHPESYRVHQLAGEVYEAQGKGDQAIREYNLALKENERVAGIHARIGQILLQEGGVDSETKALAEFQRELVIDPESATAEYAIGEIFRRRQDYVQAAQHLQRAVVLDSTLAEAHIALAQMFMSQQDPQKASREAALAVQLQPRNPKAHYALMVAYRSEGKMDDAGKELALFQQLQQEHDTNFDNKLNTLLTGKAGIGQASN